MPLPDVEELVVPTDDRIERGLDSAARLLVIVERMEPSFVTPAKCMGPAPSAEAGEVGVSNRNI